MDSIANVQASTSIAHDPDTVSFSTSPTSDSFLDEALSAAVARREGQEKALLAAVKNADPSNQASYLEIQRKAAELNITKSFEGSLLGKVKTAFEKLVLSPQ